MCAARTRTLFSCGGIVATALAASPVCAQPSAPEPPPPVAPWYENFEFGAFADGYAGLNYNLPKPQSGSNGPTRSSDITNGFALHWVGLDMSHSVDSVGATVGLRFGPAVTAYSGPDNETALQNVKQAYATWKPSSFGGRFSLDFGKFDTIYGAEAFDTQNNINYTVGVVPSLVQPFFHTGLRMGIELSESAQLTVLAVNGWNNSVDNNAGKSFGLQLQFQPIDNLGVTLGYLGGPEQDDSLTASCPDETAYDRNTGGCGNAPGATAADYTIDRGGANEFEAWRHLIDVVVTWDPADRLTLFFNGDLVTEGVRVGTVDTQVLTQTVFGGSLGARYQLTDVWAVAARGEYAKHDGDGVVSYLLGAASASFATATATVEAAIGDHLIMKLDTRADVAFALDAGGDAHEVFQKDARDTSATMFTSTLGVVVKTN